VLRGFPDPWTSEFNYESTELRLEVFGCDATWHVLESWNLLFDPCVDEGYPTHTFSQPWPPPAPCDCAFDPDTDAVIEPCVPCPELTAIADPHVPSSGDAPYRCNDGNKPTRGGSAATFTAAVDGEWINLANWEDGNGVSPAGSLPGADDTVTIAAGAVVSSCAGAVPSVHTLKIDGELQIEIEAVDLFCTGQVNASVACAGVIGKVTTSRLCDFKAFGILSGIAVPAGAPATFYGNATMQGSTVDGNAAFYDTASNEAGTVTGSAIFNNNSFNGVAGTIEGNATFNGGSHNNALVEGDATFNGSAYNLVQVNGNATFNGTSENRAPGVVQLNATFNGDSVNFGSVNGTATFNENACNDGGIAGAFVPNPPPSC
jgi:hypothetical protein